ncbi:MAG: OmpA family protein, partial [Bacteroidetes bacterium]|nr:OmpA family protein [Bacteroidota bacterium]
MFFIIGFLSSHMILGQAKKDINIKQSISYVLFESAKFDLDVYSKHRIDSIYALWKDSSNYRIYLYGNTDSVGDLNYNLKLSNNRVEAVSKYLQRLGIDTSKIKYAFYGENNPKYNNDEAHKYLNRRVDIVIRYVPTIPKPKKVVKPKVVKKIPKPVEVEEPIVDDAAEKDTLIRCQGMTITLPISYYTNLRDSGYEFKCRFCDCFGYIKLFHNGELTDTCLPKSVKVNIAINPNTTKMMIDSLKIFDADNKGKKVRKYNIVRRIGGDSGNMITFRTRCISTYDCNGWWDSLLRCYCTGICCNFRTISAEKTLFPIGLSYYNNNISNGISISSFTRVLRNVPIFDMFSNTAKSTFGVGVFLPFNKYDSTQSRLGFTT